MRNRPKAIVLGGTNPHIALIENLQERGYYTVLVDYYESPPAVKVADEHIRESTLDFVKVIEIAKKLDAKLVISACIDQANVTACYVAEKLGLPAPYSYETALNVSNKGLMKKGMLENGIPTSKYIFVNSIVELGNTELTFPVVVKPSDSTGSKGVRKASNQLELNEYLIHAIEISRTNEAIIEEFKDGIEVQSDFFVKEKVASLIMMRKKFKMVSNNGSVLQSFGSVIPVDISQKAQENMLRIADRITQAFNLEDTSLFFQSIVTGDDVNVIELASRVGGGLSYRIIKVITGFDILDATVDSFLGLPVEIDYQHPDFFYSTILIYAQPSLFGSIVGHKELLEKKLIEEFYLLKTKGMEIGSEMASRNRVGSLLVKANSQQDLFKKMKIAIEKLEVYDIGGNPIMRKDIFQGIMM